MSEISATNDAVSTQAGRDSVVHTDDRNIYQNCIVTIHVHHHERGAWQALMLPVVLFLVLLIVHSAYDSGMAVATTPFGEKLPQCKTEVQIYFLDV